MAELMLINPSRRRGKRRPKMSKKQRRYFGKRASKRSNTRPRVTLRRRKRATYMSNPRKRYRRNPASGFRPMSFINQTLMPAAIGGAGALGLDLLMGFIPLPAAMKTGPMRPIIRIVGAIGIGMIAGMVTNKRLGEQVGAGAMTVVLYDTLKGFMRTAMPNVNLGDIETDYPQMEYLSPAPQVDDLSAYVESNNVGENVGEYVY